jgi:hypothetical protein
MENFLFGLSATELVGYLASAVVMLSFLNRRMKTLRIVNAVGCVLFVAYGFMLDLSWPIIITNAFIFVVHIYYLMIKQAIE